MDAFVRPRAQRGWIELEVGMRAGETHAPTAA